MHAQKTQGSPPRHPTLAPTLRAMPKTAVDSSMTGQDWSGEELYLGFSWHSCNEKTRKEASALIDKIRTKGGKAAVDWEGFFALPDGFYFQWKKPVNLRAGYQWLSRRLGTLVSEPGQTSNWRVHGHPKGFDPTNTHAASETALAQTASSEPGGAASSAFGATGADASEEACSSTPAGATSRSAAATASRDVAAGAAEASASAPVPVCACPVLLLSARRQELGRRREAYAFEHKLGQGSFGSCFLARRKTDGQEVAVKALNMGPDHLREAFVEAHVLDRCKGQQHIPQLLDVFMEVATGQLHLVLEYAGTDLQKLLRSSGEGLPPAAVRDVTQHVASALQFLHGLGLLHTDVKPPNIFVKMSGSGGATAKLGDVGSVVEASSCLAALPCCLAALPFLALLPCLAALPLFLSLFLFPLPCLAALPLVLPLPCCLADLPFLYFFPCLPSLPSLPLLLALPLPLVLASSLLSPFLLSPCLRGEPAFPDPGDVQGADLVVAGAGGTVREPGFRPVH